jgi:hypothetical protein
MEQQTNTQLHSRLGHPEGGLICEPMSQELSVDQLANFSTLVSHPPVQSQLYSLLRFEASKVPSLFRWLS